MLNFEEYKAKYIGKEKEKETLEQLLINISEYMDLPVSKIISKSRKAPLVKARMYYFFTARYLINSIANESLTYLGSTLDKHHGTVLNSIKLFNNYYLTESEFRDEYNVFICGVYGVDAFNRLQSLMSFEKSLN